jgi:hypothetical protein
VLSVDIVTLGYFRPLFRSHGRGACRSTLAPHSFRGLALAIVRRGVLNLACGNAHDVNLVADHVGGAFLAFRPGRHLAPLAFSEDNESSALVVDAASHHVKIVLAKPCLYNVDKPSHLIDILFGQRKWKGLSCHALFSYLALSIAQKIGAERASVNLADFQTETLPAKGVRIESKISDKHGQNPHNGALATIPKPPHKFPTFPDR